MKVVLILLVFAGGQSNGAFYPMPSMADCKDKRAELLKEIADSPEVTSYAVECVAVKGKA